LSLAVSEFSSLTHRHISATRCDRKDGEKNLPERSVRSYRGVHDHHPLLKQRKYSLSDLNSIQMPSHTHTHTHTHIWYHKKNFTYYIHKKETPQESTFLSMNIFTHADSFSTPYFSQVPCLLCAENFRGVLSNQ
jgi:hypothetical protein